MGEVMAWYLKTAKTYRVKWKGDLIRLFRALKKDEEVQEEDLPPDFTKIPATPSYAVIESYKYHQLLAFRVPVPSGFISTLRTSHQLLPSRKTTAKQRGNYSSRHYALWGDYSSHPYMSSEYVQDGDLAQ